MRVLLLALVAAVTAAQSADPVLVPRASPHGRLSRLRPYSKQQAPAQILPPVSVPVASVPSEPVPIIETTSGQVKGAPSKYKPAVHAYQAIPFAKPPVGDLRWRAPQPFPKSATVHDGSYSGASCMQIPIKPPKVKPGKAPKPPPELPPALMAMAGNLTQSEDCLTLNVWTKPGGSTPKAVIHWIYGGAFMSGASSAGVYDGSVLADENDVIVVSSNYRLGVFGFGTGPDIDSNVALQDQRLALEWTRDNIAKFGGDPKRIVTMGQSAGGVLVDVYTYAYPEDPIIAGIIPMSGSAGIFEGMDLPATGANGFKAFSESFKCAGKKEEVDPVAQTKCLRNVPAFDILLAQFQSHRYKGKDYWPALPVFPTPDNKLVFGDYPQRKADGKFAKVPTLVGSTNDELPYSLPYRRAHIKKPVIPEEDSRLSSYFMTDMAVKCPAFTTAQSRMKAGVPSWLYIYMGDFLKFPNKIVGGNVHFSDVLPTFGMWEYLSGKKPTADEEAYGKFARSAWTTFAKDPVAGLSQPPFSWPKFSNATFSNSVIKLAPGNKAEVKYSTAEAEYGLCPFVKCAGQLVPPPQKLSKQWVRDASKAPDLEAVVRLFRKHGKTLHAQMKLFKTVLPGARAQALPMFAACQADFPIGPVPSVP